MPKVRSIGQLANKKKRKISIEKLEENLYTKNIPDPDLMIRTGGNKRLSNFLLFQGAYSELISVDEYWPELTSAGLEQCFATFNGTKRNYGA